MILLKAIKNLKMATIKVNDKEYDSESLSDEAKANLVSLQFAQNELKRLEGKIAVFRTAIANYSKAVENLLPE
tara:strand:+ start:187 stop:405 length:219 start_codon:yes stop_codon:yes gene_type:complete